MIRYILMLLALASPALAQAPTQVPSFEVFMGPTLGKAWSPASALFAGVRHPTGTTDTILAADIGKLVVEDNGSAVAVTLPQAGTAGFETYKCFNILTLGAGTATVTPTTSTINGGATKTYAQNASGRICSDGTNYWSF